MGKVFEGVLYGLRDKLLADAAASDRSEDPTDGED